MELRVRVGGGGGGGGRAGMRVEVIQVSSPQAIYGLQGSGGIPPRPGCKWSSMFA